MQSHVPIPPVTSEVALEMLYWNSSHPRSNAGNPQGERAFLAIPSRDNVRMLLPARPALASASLRRARRNVTRRDIAKTIVASYALRVGAGRLIGDVCTVSITEPSIESIFAEIVQAPVVPAMFLGPPRANRKPVIQIAGQDGTLLGVAKLGVNDLTDRLVRAEAHNLQVLSDHELPHVAHPILLAELDWNGHPLVVQSAIPVWKQSRADRYQQRLLAMQDIAHSAGTYVDYWHASQHHSRLVRRIESIEQAHTRNLLTEALNLIGGREFELEFGAWHGDLSSWNMTASGSGPALVWDWERYEVHVPVGFDALHYAFTPMLKRPARASEPSTVELWHRAAELLTPFGISQSAAKDVAALYVVDIASRYAFDRQDRTGVKGGEVVKWVRPLISELCKRGNRG